MKNKKPTTQINLMIRVIAAIYLIYLAHGLITGLDTAPNPRLMAIVAVLFTFAGVLIIAFVIKAFVNKEYTDMRDIDTGTADTTSETTEPSEGSVIDETVTDEGTLNNKETEVNKGLGSDSKNEQ